LNGLFDWASHAYIFAKYRERLVPAYLPPKIVLTSKKGHHRKTNS
jgi:hypothetical protein